MEYPGVLKPTAFLWAKSAQSWAHRDGAYPSFE
jgi:hypothetical protein